MKFFLLALCISVLVALGQAKLMTNSNTSFQTMIKECKEEIHPTNEDMDTLRNDTPLTMNAKCLLACVQTKGKIMRDGVYQKDLIHLGIRKILEGSDNNDKTFEDLTKCENKMTSTEKCELAAQLHECLRNFYHIEW